MARSRADRAETAAPNVGFGSSADGNSGVAVHPCSWSPDEFAVSFGFAAFGREGKPFGGTAYLTTKGLIELRRRIDRVLERRGIGRDDG